MKVTYNDRGVVLDLHLSPFEFLALLVRMHRWHSHDPNFRGILTTVAGDTILLHPVYS